MRFQDMNSSLLLLAALLLLLSCGGRAAPTAPADVMRYEFSDYVREHYKVYANAVEYAERKAIFETNKKRIVEHNQEGHSYLKGFNQFSDRFGAELGAPLTENVSPRRLLAEALAVRAEPYSSFRTEAPLPESFSWQDHQPPVVAPVRNSGKCAANLVHVIVQCAESVLALQTNRTVTPLSVQQLISCGAARCDQNHFGDLLDTIERSGGIVSESDYPARSWATGMTSTCGLSTSMKRLVKSIGVTPYIAGSSSTRLMRKLVENGPLAIPVSVLGWHDYSGGVFAEAPTTAVCWSLNHYVQLVGYGYDNATKQHYWTVRNSWGSTWGEKGYIRLRRERPSEPERCNEFCCGTSGMLHAAFSFKVSWPVPEGGSLSSASSNSSSSSSGSSGSQSSSHSSSSDSSSSGSSGSSSSEDSVPPVIAVCPFDSDGPE